MSRYSIMLDDVLGVEPGEYLPKHDTGMVRAGEEWGLPGVKWLPFEMPRLLAGSDYDGGSVTVSNHRVFLKEFENVPGVYRFSSGYRGYGVLLAPWALAWVTEGNPVEDYGVDDDPYSSAGRRSIETVRDYLARLDDYCILDESDMSAVEREAEDSAWGYGEAYGYWRDYRDALIKRFPWMADEWPQRAIYLDEERAAGILDSSQPDNASRNLPSLTELCREVSDRASIYWENQTGNTAYLDVDRLAESTTASDLAELGILPDVAGSVSHGTMLARDLIPVFLATLDAVTASDDEEAKSAIAELRASYSRLRATVGWEDSEESDWLLESLCDALDARAPEGYYFGSHPGDGSDYGYWTTEDND